jgi:hypothetical protein
MKGLGCIAMALIAVLGLSSPVWGQSSQEGSSADDVEDPGPGGPSGSRDLRLCFQVSQWLDIAVPAHFANEQEFSGFLENWDNFGFSDVGLEPGTLSQETSPARLPSEITEMVELNWRFPQHLDVLQIGVVGCFPSWIPSFSRESE